jgi:hypothetical protein
MSSAAVRSAVEEVEREGMVQRRLFGGRSAIYYTADKRSTHRAAVQ